jgi:hypothetical protein
MDLLDALSSNQTARSPVELSLNPLFRRDYSALYKAIEKFNFSRDCALSTGEGNHPTQEAEPIKRQPALLSLITEVIPAPVQRDFTRIITSIGTPAKVPKTRGYSSGRAKGTCLNPRTRHQVIKKHKKRVPKPHKVA